MVLSVNDYDNKDFIYFVKYFKEYKSIVELIISIL